MDFKTLGISDTVIKGLSKEKITSPTKVQQDVIQKIIENNDVIVQSETGSGKTLAYLLPIYEKLFPIEKGMKVIVLVPTHELAMQVHRQVERLSKHAGVNINSAVIIGEVNINRQIEKVKEKQQIIIGTPGRILELIKKRKISAHTIQTVIVDEADKMLGVNHIEGVKAVIKCCMRDTQKLFFSASLNMKTIEEAKNISKNLMVIKTSDGVTIPKNINHVYLVVERREKIEYLRKLIHSLKPKKAMVFINKAADIEEATQKLQYHSYQADCIYGSTIKEERKRVMNQFRSGKIQILLATDLAARGIHVEGVTTVIHVSIPEDPMDYLHRAGRAGRGKEKGLSISLVTKNELERIRQYQKAFGIQIEPKSLSQGKLIHYIDK